MIKGLVGLPCDDARHGGLTRSGGAVKDQIGSRAALDDAAEHGPLSQQMLLSRHLIQSLRTNGIGQRLHAAPSSRDNDLLYHTEQVIAIFFRSNYNRRER